MDKHSQKSLNEVININGSKVFIGNGKVRTILNKNIQKSGYMNLEEARQLLHAKIDKIEELTALVTEISDSFP